MEPSGARPVRALVLEGDGKPALAAVRSLGRAGCEVDVVAAGRGAMAFASRYCRRRFVEPSIREADAWRAFLLERLREGRYDAMLLAGQSSAERIGERRELFDPLVRMLLPDADSFRVALDKVQTLRLAQRLGVPVPHTLFPADVAELERAAQGLAYPQVVKGATGSGSTRVRYAASPAQLIEQFVEVARLGAGDASPPMVQEQIVGEGVGYAGLFRQGQPLAEFMWRRLQEYPATGGPSAAAESIADDGLRSLARTTFEALRWTGPAMIEFKRDRRDGTLRLMEINPRFWGSLELAIRCGVDFPRLYLDACLDRPFAPVLSYRVGRRLSFLNYKLLRGLASPAGGFSLLWDLARPLQFDIDWRDLKPTLREVRAIWWDYRSLRQRGAPGPPRPAASAGAKS